MSVRPDSSKRRFCGFTCASISSADLTPFEAVSYYPNISRSSFACGTIKPVSPAPWSHHPPATACATKDCRVSGVQVGGYRQTQQCAT